MKDEEQRGIVATIVHRAPWWVPWAFLFILFASWAAFQYIEVTRVSETNQAARQLIREAQLESCERVNSVRQEVNLHADIIKDVLAAATESALSRNEPQTAAVYIEQMSRLEELRITDCEQAFPEEIQQSGFFVVNRSGDA